MFQIYTTDRDGRLSGTVLPQRLLISPAKKLISDLMEPVPTEVTVEEDQEVVVLPEEMNDLTSMPVVDDDGKLVGHITVDDVLDVAAEEADEDIYHMAGTDAAELETSSILRASGIRLAWLLPSFLFMAGTAMVILKSESHFDPRIHAALIAFVPMIGALAGCCSVQTSTIITRGLATGEFAATHLLLAFKREIRIAFVLAPCCALIACILTWFLLPVLKPGGDVEVLSVALFRLAGAVGIGMLAGICTASLLGISMPFLFRRFGIDPAIAAGPIVTALNDVLCVTIYLVLGYWVVRMREIRIAFVLAPCCALIACILTWFLLPVLKPGGDVEVLSVALFRLAGAVGIGMLAGICTASLLGISMPFLFRRFGIDPAIAAGPIVTALNDVLCVTIYLVLGYWVVSI